MRALIRKNGMTLLDMEIETLIDLYLMRSGTYIMRPYFLTVQISEHRHETKEVIDTEDDR